MRLTQLGVVTNSLLARKAKWGNYDDSAWFEAGKYGRTVPKESLNQRKVLVTVW